MFAGGKDDIKGVDVYTEDQLDEVRPHTDLCRVAGMAALMDLMDEPSSQALDNYVPKNRKEGRMSFLEVHFDRMDVPPSLSAAGESMAAKNRIAK